MQGLQGDNQMALRYVDRNGHSVLISAGYNMVIIDHVRYDPALLRFLASLADSGGLYGYQRQHLMSECYWVDCPEHRCEYTMSHLRDFCGRPTCRES